MKIIVAVKQVPERDSPARIAGTWIEETDLQFTMNELDAYALEEALRLKDRHGCEVVVVSVGPDRVGTTVYEALAKGADRAIHVLCDDLASRDALGVARLLAAAIEPEMPALVFTGLQSEDLALGQTGVILAELLHVPYSTLILQMEFTGTGIQVKRELEGGYLQFIELPSPAVLTIQSGGNKLRYATLMGIRRAKAKEVRTIAASDLGCDFVPVVRLEEIVLPRRQRATTILSGTAQEATAALVEKLKFEARVL
jgi:electron transfer flavoprotein beta subunit